MSVHKLKERGPSKWQVRWREEGRNRSKRFERREDAVAFDAEQKVRARRRRELGGFATPAASPIPLREHLDICWRTRSATWAKTTTIMRADVIDAWILPLIGDVPLRDLTTQRLREFEASMMTSGVTPPGGGRRRRASNDTVNRVRRVLSAFLGYAVLDGLLPENPCRQLRRMPHKPTKHRALPPIVLERMRIRMTERDALMVSLMYLAGLRPEEALALQWRHVGQKTLFIEQATTSGELKETKTTSTASVELVRHLAEDLAARRAAITPADSDFVIPSREGERGVITLRHWRSKIWHAARIAAGEERCTPYDCRHTFGSLLIHEGRDILEVQRAMRHSTPRMTLEHYAHEFAEWKGRDKVTLEQAVADARAQARAELDGDGAQAGDSTPPTPPKRPKRSRSSRNVPDEPPADDPGTAPDPDDDGDMGVTGLEPVTPSLSSLPNGGEGRTSADGSGDAEPDPDDPDEHPGASVSPSPSPRVPEMFPSLGRCCDCNRYLSLGLEGTFCEPCEVACPSCGEAE